MLPDREHPLYYLDAETLLFLGLKWRHPGLDVVRVVDVGLGGKPDLEVLEWAAREGRVVVSRDRATLSAEAAQRVSQGRPMPGLILLRRGAGWGSPPQVLLEKRGKRIAAIAALAVKPVWEGISACGYCAAIAGKRERIAASGHDVLERLCGVCGVCGYCSAAPSESQGALHPK